ncbi:MAG: hypothetical protein WAU57_00515 [Xanthobacteraceae bacterium]
MARFDLSIRTKLAIWAALGVLLVAGMLLEQQIGDRYAAQLRQMAANEQLTAVEALRAAKDLGNMRLELREIRLALSPHEVDGALDRMHAAVAATANHIKFAVALSATPADKTPLQKLAALAKNYDAVGVKLAAAARDYGDTVSLVQAAGKIGDAMNALVEKTTEDLIGAAKNSELQATAEREHVDRIDLGIGLFVICVLGGAALFGVLAIIGPIRRIGDVLFEIAHGDKDVVIP